MIKEVETRVRPRMSFCLAALEHFGEVVHDDAGMRLFGTDAVYDLDNVQWDGELKCWQMPNVGERSRRTPDLVPIDNDDLVQRRAAKLAKAMLL